MIDENDCNRVLNTVTGEYIDDEEEIKAYI